jgi:hypothetical protein
MNLLSFLAFAIAAVLLRTLLTVFASSAKKENKSAEKN